jgi:hypothetical protein
MKFKINILKLKNIMDLYRPVSGFRRSWDSADYITTGHGMDD